MQSVKRKTRKMNNKQSQFYNIGVWMVISVDRNIISELVHGFLQKTEENLRKLILSVLYKSTIHYCATIMLLSWCVTLDSLTHVTVTRSYKSALICTNDSDEIKLKKKNRFKCKRLVWIENRTIKIRRNVDFKTKFYSDCFVVLSMQFTTTRPQIMEN